MSFDAPEILNDKNPTLVSEKENTMAVLMQKVLGGNSIMPTEKQTDELLSQRRQVIDFVHNDKIRDSRDNLYYFFTIVVASLLVIVLVLFFAREYFTQVLALIIGGLGGYGLGKSQ